MANNKDPAVLFYTSDFLSGCALMDMRERGQYITLLCLQRERGHMTMQEIIRAVKKPSDEVMSKFQKDEDGKYFNRRMELEIEKRDKHCQRQRENISKRWNKENDNSGMADGSACGNTTVLPLGNGNGNRKESSSISEKKRKKFIPPTLEDVSAYAKERGVPNLAQKFFDYYSAGNWVDGKGDPVRNWKQKFLTWESKEHEKGTPPQPGKKPGYNVQHHDGDLSDLQKAAIQRMLGEEA